MRSTLNQGYTLLLFLYAGLMLGVIYDVCRFFRFRAVVGMAQHLWDGLFAFAFLVVAMTAFRYATGGGLRLYGFLCMAAGMALQQWAFGLPICKIIVNRKKRRRQ